MVTGSKCLHRTCYINLLRYNNNTDIYIVIEYGDIKNRVDTKTDGK